MGIRVKVIGNNASNFTSYVVTNIEGPATPSEDSPAARLCEGPFGTVHIVPDWAAEADGVGPMFDGAFAYAHDSRFGRAVEKLSGSAAMSHAAIAVHDRIESQEVYDVLSR